MKLLRILVGNNKAVGQFLDLSAMGANPFEEKYFKNIELIARDNIIDIVLHIITSSDAEFDEYKEGTLLNPAQDLLYKELYSEFMKLNGDRLDILKTIDDAFAEIEVKYK